MSVGRAHIEDGHYAEAVHRGGQQLNLSVSAAAIASFSHITARDFGLGKSDPADSGLRWVRGPSHSMIGCEGSNLEHLHAAFNNEQRVGP